MIMIQSRNAAFSPKTIVAAFMLALAVLGVSAPAQAEEGAQKEESRAQQLMGDVTPKLADLTAVWSPSACSLRLTVPNSCGPISAWH